LEPKDGLEVKEPELSLHAVDGGSSPKTIKLLGQINRKPVSIFLDTGSTHNFIDPKMVHRAGLQVTPEISFKVTVAEVTNFKVRVSVSLCMSSVREWTL